MGMEDIKTQIPDYAKDIKLNLGSLLSEETLTVQQLWGCVLACAIATRVKPLIDAALEDAQKHLSPEAVSAAQSAAAIMAMNNVYYRTMHIAHNEQLRTLPARLRMNVIANPGIDKVDFELFSLAVSALNGCGMCIDAHDHELAKAGVTLPVIQGAIRIAAVMNAVATVI